MEDEQARDSGDGSSDQEEHDELLNVDEVSAEDEESESGVRIGVNDERLRTSLESVAHGQPCKQENERRPDRACVTVKHEHQSPGQRQVRSEVLEHAFERPLFAPPQVGG